jgi:hypothetical protein
MAHINSENSDKPEENEQVDLTPEKVVTLQPIPYNDLYNNDPRFAFPNQRT